MISINSAGKYMHFMFQDDAHNQVGEFLLLAPGDAVSIGTVKLRGFEIYPTYRGKGFSYAMLAAVVREARTYNFREIVLQVKTDNVIARKLYEASGFVITYEDVIKSELEMELDIS